MTNNGNDIEDRQVRKKLIIQVTVLLAVCILAAAGGRLLSGNRFKMTVGLSEISGITSSDDVQIMWQRSDGTEQGEMISGSGEPVLEKLEVIGSDKLLIVLCPDEPGDYDMSVASRTGESLFYDILHVNRLRTISSAQTGNFTGDNALIFGAVLFCLGLAVLSLRYFTQIHGSAMYSYYSILTCGAGIFCTVAGLNMLIQFIQRISQAQVYGMRAFYESLSLAGWNFMCITSPLVLVFSLMMIVSNIALLRHERFRIQNILGLGIGFALILSEVLGVRLMFWNLSGSEMKIRVFYVLSSVYFTTFCYFECILMGSVICGLRAARHVPALRQDYILILGCGFNQDGTLPPLLRGRVDKAIEFWKRQKEETGREAVLVPSGGQGIDESMPEAEAMGRYLRECGIPERAIMQEEKSTNTYQNMAFSKKLIEDSLNLRDGYAQSDAEAAGKDRAANPNTIFVTTNYHVFRSGVWARTAGLCAEGLGSKTKWWFWPNAFVRECAGLLVNRIVPEIVWLVILAALFGSIATLIV